MNVAYLAAAALAAITCALHIVAGGRETARPLLASGLDPLAKFTAYYCWHLVSLTLAAQAGAFLYAAIAADGARLADAAALLCFAAALWSLGMIRSFRLPLLRFPQWSLFLAMAGLGLAGHLA